MTNELIIITFKAFAVSTSIFLILAGREYLYLLFYRRPRNLGLVKNELFENVTLKFKVLGKKLTSGDVVMITTSKQEIIPATIIGLKEEDNNLMLFSTGKVFAIPYDAITGLFIYDKYGRL